METTSIDCLISKVLESKKNRKEQFENGNYETVMLDPKLRKNKPFDILQYNKTLDINFDHNILITKHVPEAALFMIYFKRNDKYHVLNKKGSMIIFPFDEKPTNITVDQQSFFSCDINQYVRNVLFVLMNDQYKLIKQQVWRENLNPNFLVIEIVLGSEINVRTEHFSKLSVTVNDDLDGVYRKTLKDLLFDAKVAEETRALRVKRLLTNIVDEVAMDIVKLRKS